MTDWAATDFPLEGREPLHVPLQMLPALPGYRHPLFSWTCWQELYQSSSILMVFLVQNQLSYSERAGRPTQAWLGYTQGKPLLTCQVSQVIAGITNAIHSANCSSNCLHDFSTAVQVCRLCSTTRKNKAPVRVQLPPDKASTRRMLLLWASPRAALTQRPSMHQGNLLMTAPQRGNHALTSQSSCSALVCELMQSNPSFPAANTK